MKSKRIWASVHSTLFLALLTSGVGLVGGAVLTGCGEAGAGEADSGASKATEFGYQVTPQTMRLIEGKRAYESYCIGCHGVKGDGRGEGARMMIPHPRDFTKANYKFISTRFGELPTDEDLFRTITHGLRGSAMPRWGQLPEETRWALIAYIKSFSDVWSEGDTSSIPVVADPYADQEDKSKAIARGERAYHGFFTCWNCHPAYVDDATISKYVEAMGGTSKETYRLNIKQTAPKTDSAGKTIFAPDFKRDYVKSGTTLPDLYRTIGAGITGTAMPTWIDSVAPDEAPRDADGNMIVSQADIWAIAYYIQDLVKQRKVKFPADAVIVRTNRNVVLEDGRMEFVFEVKDATAADDGESEEFLDEDEDDE